MRESVFRGCVSLARALSGWMESESLCLYVELGIGAHTRDGGAEAYLFGHGVRVLGGSSERVLFQSIRT